MFSAYNFVKAAAAVEEAFSTPAQSWSEVRAASRAPATARFDRPCGPDRAACEPHPPGTLLPRLAPAQAFQRFQESYRKQMTKVIAMAGVAMAPSLNKVRCRGVAAGAPVPSKSTATAHPLRPPHSPPPNRPPPLGSPLPACLLPRIAPGSHGTPPPPPTPPTPPLPRRAWMTAAPTSGWWCGCCRARPRATSPSGTWWPSAAPWTGRLTWCGAWRRWSARTWCRTTPMTHLSSSRPTSAG